MSVKHLLSLKELGLDAAWLLLRQTRGILETRAKSTFMEGRTVVLLFTRESFSVRLCITAAVHQMSGDVVYLDSGSWPEILRSFPRQMPQLVGQYLDCAFLYGLPLEAVRRAEENAHVPLINAGSPDGSPVDILADMACMYRFTPDFAQVTVAWLGCLNGAFYSLLEAMEYFPFQLRVYSPEGQGISEERIPADLRSRIYRADSREDAVQGAQYLYAGCALGLADDEERACWQIRRELVAQAAPDARILIAGAFNNSLPVEHELLQSKVSLLGRQGEYRLRACKRLLHWVYDED